MTAAEAIGRLEAICAEDPGGRHIAALAAATRGSLGAAAASIADHPDPSLALLSGCFIPRGTPPSAETDGPVGMALLAAGLSGDGIAVRAVTDDACAPVLTAALEAVGGAAAVPLDVVPVAVPAQIAGLAARLRGAGPPVTHMVAIERLGPARDGGVYNMRGESVADRTAPLHELYLDGPWTRIAVGDGGNEIGMGSLPEATIAGHIPSGGRIACTVPADHLIVAGVSNWGAIALLCAVAALRPSLRRRLSGIDLVAVHDAVLEAVVLRGPAVDGVSRSRVRAVDGLPPPVHTGVVRQMLDALAAVV